uniref:Uncharacterized protein n=1 Tax=Oryza punctata TaxID=4537 RepID=A0A0E0LTS9_ORYPU
MRRRRCVAVDLGALGKGYSAGMEEPVQEQCRLVHIRSKVLLSEILRGIGANAARYNCRAVTDGYVGFAKASVHGVRAGEEPFLVRAQSIPAIRPCDAEESTTHALISVIKKECRVEIADMNWFDMNRYHGETLRLKRALGRVKKERGRDADALNHREVGVLYDVHRLGEYAESKMDEWLANLSSVTGRCL